MPQLIEWEERGLTPADAILRGPEAGGRGDEGSSELAKALDHLLDPLDGLSPASRTDPRAATADDENTAASGPGSSELNEAGDAQKPVTRGENVHASIKLRTFQAHAGARRVIRFKLTDICSHCAGNGLTRMPDPNCETCAGGRRLRDRPRAETNGALPLQSCPECGGASCANCKGAGRVEAERRLSLLIPPGLQDGSRLRVAGEGSVPESIGVPGDLLVRVHVLSQPKDSRVARYLSFALLLVALAVLAYLLRH
jgi:DnaJ-class molecular chaperone